MKKKGIIDTLVKAGIAAAAIGGTIYLLKDKFEEDPKYKEAVDKVKDTIKSYMPAKDEKPVDEDDFFDEDFDQVIHTSSERGYVNIKLPTEEDFEEFVDAAEDKAEQVVEAAEEKIEQLVDAAEDKAEQAAEAVEEFIEK
ncbi:MAG: hypothetical protein E7253_07645 [Lachnospiraceae bacterium]|nr:hypothetical protein [Lachnospiraceae bacterium]